MEHKMTPAFRPVCKAVNEAIGGLPSGAFNFGLYFQKWFYVVNRPGLQDSWKRGHPWACPTADETDLKKGNDICPPNLLLDNMEVSLAIFNGAREYGREVTRVAGGKVRISSEKKRIDGSWDRKKAEGMLAKRHALLEKCVNAFKQLGYDYLRHEVPLSAPLVIGLGNEHPTEKGFRFDWTLGVPCIPASGIKGVVRLAYLVNALDEFPTKEEAESFWREVRDDRIPECAQHLFGCSEVKNAGQKAMRGKVIFLDALPAELPRLKPEIMNCHYPDYLNKSERGPTEDQQPNPQKFWAVDPYLDENGTPLKFVFRLLLHRDVAGDKDYGPCLMAAFEAALQEHGLGAKTAIGHGRFNISCPVERGTSAKADQGSVSIPEPTTDKLEISQAQPKEVHREIWGKATLVWTSNNKTITAHVDKKSATSKDQELVPNVLRKKLFEKRKPVVATVEVEPVGNAYRIVRILAGTE
ncbi:MAG: type III-B CRISPR module RAMP protein Cmr6 [Deltaproteobacteria bacterium]|nr:type III-B CRISPR module RAMP protein Cmr6 [Deltaproteobacteria bacterium]